MPAPKDPEKRKLWIENMSKAKKGKKGRPWSQKQKDKMSKAMMGNKNGLGHKFPDVIKKRFSQERKGTGNPFFGHKRPLGWKEKMMPIWKDRVGPKNPNWKEKIQKSCPICGKSFEVIPAEKDQKSCSRKCMAKLFSGPGNPRWHKHHTQKTKNKISRARIGKYVAEKNSNWQGGRSFEPYTLEFNTQLKAIIRHRDGYKCQKCGCPEIENNQRLDIHHIDYNKQNCKPFNLISLCKRCNSKVNSNRSYWTKYFTRKIKKIMSSSSLQLHFNYTAQKKQKNCNIVPISET